MKKLAIFVEGYTELQFVDRLIQEVAGSINVLIEQRAIIGGTTVPRRIETIRAAKPASGQKYYVLLIDCGGDQQVKTRIREEHVGLTRSGFSKIIGIRDVRPKFTHAELPKLIAGLPYAIKTSLAPVEFILAIMEIEAWFLAEFNHFPIIDPAITVPTIRASLNFDPEHDDMAQRSTPTDDLNACYQIGGKQYTKRNSQATISALDFDFIYMTLRRKIGYLDALARSIDAFLG